jgi:hypothetical protein
MKSRAVLCLAFVLACWLPAAAQSRADAPFAAMSANQAGALQAAPLTAPWRMAQAATGSAADEPTTDAGSTQPKTATVSKPRRHKKTATGQHPASRSGAAIVKEGGKTCSGLDEYRVCW